MTRLLLNASAGELASLGGDYTYYRDLLGLPSDVLQFDLVTDDRRRRASTLGRRAAFKALRGWQPAQVRRRLFRQSRLALIPAGQVVEKRPDFVFSHVWFPKLAGATHDLPIIWSSQGISPPAYYRYVMGASVSWDDVVASYHELGARAESLLIWTDACAGILESNCPELADKITVLHPPISGPTAALPPKPSLDDGVLRLLFIGVDAERKGLPEVLAVATRLHTSLSPRAFELTVVSRPPAATLERMAAMPEVTFIASSPDVDVRPLLRDADVLLVPTHADTYASTAVEAMAFGCAVVISDLPPLPEVVPDGLAGFAVPAGDEAVLADRVERLAGDLDLLRSMQGEARALYLRRNAPDVFARGLEELVDRLVRQAGPPPS